jgi:hypothetical protein
MQLYPTKYLSAKGGRVRPRAVVITMLAATVLSMACKPALSAESPELLAVTIQPASATVTPGAEIWFSVSGEYSDGSTLVPAVAFRANGGNVSPLGAFTAPVAGTYEVVAEAQTGVADTAQVTVTAVAPTLQSLSITPASVTVPAGGSTTFSVQAQWSDGTTTVPSLSFSTNTGSITQQGVHTAGGAVGSYRVIVAHFGGTRADTADVTVVPSGTSLVEPTPSGTIFFDGRAGGAQSFQAMSTIADFDNAISVRGGGLETTQPAGSTQWNFTTNYNGAGKRAVRIDWPANPTAQSSAPLIYYYPATYSKVYTSVVIRLGRTETGGGNGAVGSFLPVTGSGGMKRFMWYRQRDNGNDRVYWVWGSGEQATFGNALQIDNRNLTVGFPANYGVGQDVRWTFELISGNPSTMRVWRNGVLMLNNTNAGIGTLGFSQSMFPTTRFGTQQAESEYWTDLVLWTVP